jgi:hypothetical protein
MVEKKEHSGSQYHCFRHSLSAIERRRTEGELTHDGEVLQGCELEHTTPEAWAKESYEIATKIDRYENHSLRGTPKGAARDCREVRDANFLSRGYPQRAKLIAERRIYLAAVRLADTLMRSYLR